MRELAIFGLPLSVQDTDIDVLGHVSNRRYLDWALDAAEAHSVSVGLRLIDYVEGGAAFVVRRHLIDFLRPAFAGDSLLVETWIESWKAASCKRVARVHRGPELLAEATTTWAWLDLESFRPARIPASIRDRFS